jgi:phosphatidylinositol alpha-1,6-mannosyltransferase
MGATLGLPARRRVNAGPRMHVLALVTDAFGGFGGIARYNRNLFAALAHCDGAPRVTILPRTGRADPAELPPGVQQLAPYAGRVAYVGGALRAALRRGPFDVVFCGHLHMATLAAAIARLFGIPLWLQLHGVEAWEPMARVRRRAVTQARLVTAVSRFTRRHFLRHNAIDPARVRVLPNTLAHGFAPGPKPAHLLARHGLHGKRILLTVGRLAPDERRKGHDAVIGALAALAGPSPDLVYLIAGTGDDRMRLAALARERGIADRVVFAGMITPDELADYYRLADVFVMPSTQEGFGIVFLEAAAAGVPLIGGNRDGSLDALADGAVGLAIDPADPQALVHAIEDALAGRGPDPGEVRRFAFENFTRQVCALATSHLLNAPAPA